MASLLPKPPHLTPLTSVLPGPSNDVFDYRTPSRVTLAERGGSALTLDFNPAKVTLQQSAKTAGKANTLSTTNQDAIVSSGKPSITLDGIRLVGEHTQANVGQLLIWASGQPETTSSSPSPAVPRSLGIGNSQSAITTLVATGGKDPMEATKLTMLQFTWGDSWRDTVQIATLDVTYDRFSVTGKPLAASVKLILQPVETPKEQPVYDPTNPSSGGLPGRRAHVVTAGESLVSIANAAYGRTTSWRALAEVNGLDDPLRITPGRQLYLPNPGELPTGGTPWS
jgi:nucleoid-associated protein YgaU